MYRRQVPASASFDAWQISLEHEYAARECGWTPAHLREPGQLFERGMAGRAGNGRLTACGTPAHSRHAGSLPNGGLTRFSKKTKGHSKKTKDHEDERP